MKRKFTAFFLSLIVIVSAAFSIQPTTYAEFAKKYELKTQYNPDFYSEFSISGFTITASGKYSGELVESVSLLSWDVEKNSLKALSDGSYTAEITGPKNVHGRSAVVITFKRGFSISYPLYADDNGLYFPDNSLGESSYEKFSHIIEAPKEAAAYYLSATADPDEIKDTQERLKTLADEITAGVDDEYEQARLICRWVADNVYYDHFSADTSVTVETVAVANVLDIKRTVCAGYANTCCALMQAKGIRSVNIKGSAVAGDVTYDTLTTGVENHEWSAFWYEKGQRWVYVDSCWCSGNDYYDSYRKGTSTDKYFDPTELSFSFNHRVDKVEERDYFADFTAISETAETTAEETTAAETTQVTSETTAVTSTQREAQTSAGDLPMLTDNAGTTILLYAMISVLLIGVIVLAVALYIKKRNGKNQ